MKVRNFSPLVAAVVLLALGVAVAQAAPMVPTTEGVNWESGNVCVADYIASPNCTAADVAVEGVVPTLSEVCTSVGDQATAQFKFQFLSNASERYDVGLFIATDGTQVNETTKTGGAKYGNACYHDFLQPASTTSPWDLIGGFGAFKSLDGDACAEIIQNDGINYYYTQVPVTITCVDANSDGVVDPISVCTSYDNNAGGTCTTVANAKPSTVSKCYCQTAAPNPPVLLYKGLDFGDLPESYVTSLPNGPRHAIQDADNNAVPNTQGGVVAVWLGSYVDHSGNAETNGQPNAAATGDDNNIQNGNLLDDEDGVTISPNWFVGTNGGKFSVTVNSSNGTTCPSCRLGFWIDWNHDDDFSEANEAYVQNVNYGTQTVTFDIPNLGPTQLTNIYTRFRLYDVNNTGTPSPVGLITNGEVEDYYFTVPTEVDLLSFTATGGRTTVLNWETASEADNLGFNVYSAGQIDGPRTKLNDDLIPSLVPPGSLFGARYSFTDLDLKLRGTYYYWLEDVDIYGNASLHGPVILSVVRGPR